MQRLRFSKYAKILIVFLDIFAISAVFFSFCYLRAADVGFYKNIWEENLPVFILILLFWVLAGSRTKLYDVPRNLTYTLFLERYLAQMVIFLFGVFLLSQIGESFYLKSQKFSLSAVLFTVLFFLKSFIYFFLKFLRSKGINHRNIMFLGNATPSSKILRNILQDRRDYGYKIFGYDNGDENLDRLIEFWTKNGIYNVYIPTENHGYSSSFAEQLFSEAENNKIKITLIPDVLASPFFEYKLSYFETLPLLTEAKFPLDNNLNYLLKRTFDIFFSLFILIFICSWLFPVIALLIKLESKGPVFFIQKRYGYHEAVFRCFKFRTMVVNNECDVSTTQENDKRITRVGNFLRKSSLDEMPQFLNVLMGNMSVVGPRPHMEAVEDHYKTFIKKYSLRSLVYPGITGLAQINGLRGDRGDMELQMQQRIMADTFYIKNWSLILDMIIIFKTILKVLKGDEHAH